jgi:hypothetical protein
MFFWSKRLVAILTPPCRQLRREQLEPSSVPIQPGLTQLSSCIFDIEASRQVNTYRLLYLAFYDHTGGHIIVSSECAHHNNSQ